MDLFPKDAAASSLLLNESSGPLSIKGNEKADTASPSPRSPTASGSVTEMEDISQDEGSDSGEEDEEAAYEQARQRRILENRALLADLGIEPSFVNAVAGPSTAPAASSAPKRKRRARPQHKLVRDRSGYVISLPPQGEVQRMACVQIPSDRRLRRLISEGAYVDCSDWSIGEPRRWRWGDGEGEPLRDDERPVVGGVAPDFRWRRWRGLRKELEADKASLEDVGASNADGEEPVAQEGVSAYSLLPAQSCHQCKRRSDKAKMQCRNLKPVCKAVFCETCCKRYSYFDFDPEARSFICPLCRNCCNCSQCLRKRNLAHLLDGKRGIKHILGQQLEAGNDGAARLTGQLSVQDLLERVAVETKIRLPFDRVRLVDRVTDVISPELPPEPVPEVVKRRRVKAKTGPTVKTATAESNPPRIPEIGDGRVGSQSRKKRARKDAMAVSGETPDGPSMADGSSAAPRLFLKLRMPKDPDPPSASAEKMYDTDGDTVAGSADEEDFRGEDGHREDSASSGASSRSATPVSRVYNPRQMPTLVPDATSQETAVSPDTVLIAEEVVKLASHRLTGMLGGSSLSDMTNTPPVMTPTSYGFPGTAPAPSRFPSERTIASHQASPPPSVVSGTSDLPSWLVSPRQRSYYGLDSNHKSAHYSSDFDTFSRPQTIDSAVAYHHGYPSLDAPFLDRPYDHNGPLGAPIYPPADHHDDGKQRRVAESGATHQAI